MKRCLIFAFLFFTVASFANTKDSTIYYSLADSVKAVSFLADVSIGTFQSKKEMGSGIQTSLVRLKFESDKKERKIEFEFPDNATVVATGSGVKSEKGGLEWILNWETNQHYKLMIATAGDSAGNFSLYSGYIFLPAENKWKLLGTCKIEGQWNTLKQPAVFTSTPKNTPIQVNVNEVWIQRLNGSWKNMLQTHTSLPVVNLFSHVDSLEQITNENKLLEKLLSPNSPIKYTESGGVYFAIMKEGTGRQVSINDTVVVYYKGYLFDDNSVFDQTNDKPATFSLKRLIMGWQIALQFCKIGGKVQVIIPSHLAYSIRTRAAKIPPNSILVFEIEVVDAKSSQ